MMTVTTSETKFEKQRRKRTSLPKVSGFNQLKGGTIFNIFL